jgi:beta-galactosidase/beta-glucuronidase
MNKGVKFLMFGFLILVSYHNRATAQNSNWEMVKGKIASPWAAQVDPASPLPEYPRPQMVRANWKNLNGLWDYAIQPQSEQTMPTAFQGKILVPFAIESALSGVGKSVGKDNVLWYKTEVVVPKQMRKQNVLLHFGGVDWQAEVFVNGQQVGRHEGGYDPFSLNITPQLKKGEKQEIALRVWDPTNDGPQPRGKQVNNPRGIWYTPVSGIWQTVWLESVPETYISATHQTPDLDQQSVAVSARVMNLQPNDQLKVTALDGENKVSEKTVGASEEAVLSISDPKLWSPENPFLYNLKVEVVRKGKVIDAVESYFGMRKISMEPDVNGVQRMLLNNEFVFQFGPLDQGWWPDGLYTAPTDEALRFDIERTRDMGFNMIRKHVKVEPARWYYHCDRLGMLVWQDMPNGDSGGRWGQRPGVEGDGIDMERTEASEKIYRTEWSSIMEDFHNFPSIVVWVPFNEGWGQFKTVEITNWTQERDPSRLVNSASGGNFHETGHILDIHNYPVPAMPRPELFGRDQILVLGEYGGLGLPVEGHTWQSKDNWGYQSFKTADELYDKYRDFISELENMISKGLSAAIYTQTTDVEVETNGLMTYDRKVIKMPVEQLKQIHRKLYDPALVQIKGN